MSIKFWAVNGNGEKIKIEFTTEQYVEHLIKSIELDYWEDLDQMKGSLMMDLSTSIKE